MTLVSSSSQLTSLQLSWLEFFSNIFGPNRKLKIQVSIALVQSQQQFRFLDQERISQIEFNFWYRILIKKLDNDDRWNVLFH